ncbi:MAG: hypothetical protein IJT41_05175 [Clostridia bacterium]|nr:hypothetical protein [Clostridia bacterium]
MADCTNTAEFLAEWARMHDAQQRDEHGFPKETCTDDNCIGCPLDIGLDCKEFAFRNINHAITKVQKWSNEHPLPKPKTYADVFFERFPNNTILTRFPKDFLWMNSLCRDVYFGGVDCCPGRDCKSCWNEPYPEQEASE